MNAIASAAEKTACLLLRAAIVAYQATVSPLLGKQCRFYPSCSHYALAAMERHGLLKGLFLGACRLMRCNGFFHGGYDPVPGDNAATHASPSGEADKRFSEGIAAHGLKDSSGTYTFFHSDRYLHEAYSAPSAVR